MLCYEIRIRYTVPNESLEKTGRSGGQDDKEPELEEKLQKLNAGVYAMTSDDDFYAFAYRADDNFLDFAVAAWPEKIGMSALKKKLESAVKSVYNVAAAKAEVLSEITAKRYTVMLNEADNRDYLKRSTRLTDRDLKFNYFNNSFFKINEEMAPTGRLTKKQAIQSAEAIMADKSLLEEVERIYAHENSRKFYGYPVHYRIQAGSRDTAMPIIKLMIQMLRSRGRILSSRINLVSEVGEECYDEEDLENACRHAEGSAFVLEMRGSDDKHGNYAISYEGVIRYLSCLVERHHRNTLFFFIEDVTEVGFTKGLVAKATDVVDVIDISEGAGGRDEAMRYLEHLVRKSAFSELADESVGEYLPGNRRIYKCHDVHRAYNDWSRDVLRNKAYCSYKKCRSVEIKDKKKKGSSYEELKGMVGLSEVKKITDQIISSYKMRSIREGYGLEDCQISKHMIFTGNPGSAKTTVARLLADILSDEGILKSGALVECGRADLVGRYVGWTAKAVRSKFKEAEGGILFIDEAYSLVDDSRTFGEEAINTIVQEMENRRNSVIVIFAGYPDKMKLFLERNEGLRSRIAFHLDFPDYQADELLQIMDTMLKARGLKADKKAKDICHEIFRRACTEAEYGNGRFVRNLIEQATLKQAQRLLPEGVKKELSKSSVRTLTASDFEVNIADVYEKKRKMPIGFCV